MSEDILTKLANQHKTDKGTTHSFKHSYTPHYHKHLKDFRDSFTKVLEIGIYSGASLFMWRDYFQKAQIYGIDIMNKENLNGNRITPFQGSQSNRSDLDRFLKSYGGEFDLIIDDGGHHMDQQMISIGVLFKHVKAGGIYILEDLHTSAPTGKDNLFKVNDDGSNSALRFIELLQGNADIWVNDWISKEEADYIMNNVESVDIYKMNNGGSITAIIKKKE